MQDKTEAIAKAPVPTNVTELRSYLALLTHCGKFMENLSTLIKDMTELLQKDRHLMWSEQCQKAFETTKTQLSSSSVLVHYDPHMPVKLACDASQYGVGAVISHTMPDVSVRPIAYASPTLTKTEVKYAQKEKEELAIIFGVMKFHDYL